MAVSCDRLPPAHLTGDTIKVKLPPLVTITPDGVMQAGTAPGAGMLQVSRELVTGTIPVSIVTRLGRLVVTPAAVTLAPGMGRTFTLTGRDAEGHPVVLPDRAGTWLVRPRWLGTFSAPGRFVAGDLAGHGTIDVELGGVTSQVPVTVRGEARPVSPRP